MSNQQSEYSAFGVLANLIGTWEGNKGMDISPEKTGEEKSPYFETLTIEPVGDATNAGEQTLMVLSYKQIVSRIADGKVFHHQIGYWYWDKSNNDILYSLAIPRAVSVLAKGGVVATGNKISFNLRATAQDKNYGIIESAFMTTKASTREFEMDLALDGDSMTYTMRTKLFIYGREFLHTDTNTLTRKK